MDAYDVYQFKMVAPEALIELPAAFKVDIERCFPGMQLKWMQLDSQNELRGCGYLNTPSKYAIVLSITAMSGTDYDDLDHD